MVNLVSSVRQAAAYISAHAEHVCIDHSEVQKVAAAFSAEELRALTSPQAFDTDMHFVDGGPLTLQYLLAVDTINFCFWPQAGLEYEHLARGLKVLSWGCAAEQGALERDAHALDSRQLAGMTGPRLQALLARPAPLPAQEQRAALLREAGQALERSWGGCMQALVLAAGGSAPRLVDLIVAAFPGFRDRAVYRDTEVWLLKRAQILVADIWGAFQGRGLGRFNDISALTMFADYRVPVVLRQMRVLRYSPALAAKVDAQEELRAGSEEEIEIRGCTVAAVEALRAALAERCAREGAAPPHSVQLDWWLWTLGERARDTAQPHHRTITTFY